MYKNIEELIAEETPESATVHFETGWRPNAIYKTVCAFANDYFRLGGGHIVIGVAIKNSRIIRPVIGLDKVQIPIIIKNMEEYNKQFLPTYNPTYFIEKADGRHLIVLWVPAGYSRPYSIPEKVTAKKKLYQYYIRENERTIEAKDWQISDLLNFSMRREGGGATFIQSGITVHGNAKNQMNFRPIFYNGVILDELLEETPKKKKKH